jgi:hypothetical protein
VCVSTSYIYKGKVKDPRYMQKKKDSRISLAKLICFLISASGGFGCFQTSLYSESDKNVAS